MTCFVHCSILWTSSKKPGRLGLSIHTSPKNMVLKCFYFQFYSAMCCFILFFIGNNTCPIPVFAQSWQKIIKLLAIMRTVHTLSGLKNKITQHDVKILTIVLQYTLHVCCSASLCDDFLHLSHCNYYLLKTVTI